LAEEIEIFLASEQFGVSANTPVNGDFIMLDALRGGDHSGVENFRFGVFFEQFLGFLDEAFHALAFFSLG